MLDSRALSAYLNNHLVVLTGTVELCRRAASNQPEPSAARELGELAAEVESDRETFKGLLRTLDVPENRLMSLAGVVGERLGRFKPNGYLVKHSPASDLVELEALRTAVAHKIALWQVLRAVAAHDDRLDRVELERLIERAQAQADRLYALHLRVAEAHLRHPSDEPG
jgi:hypothetical protein